MTAHIRYWLWTNALQCDGTKVAWGLQRKIWENTSWSPHPPIVTVWPWPRHPQLQKCCMTIKDATFEQWLRLQLAMLQLHILGLWPGVDPCLWGWCWPLWGPQCYVWPVRSPMMLPVWPSPGWFTQTPLPLWMTVPDNGPISSLTPLPFSAFSSVLSSNYFFSSFAELFQFWGWMLGDPHLGCRFMVQATASQYSQAW